MYIETHSHKKASVLPHKMYQFAYQTISEIAFSSHSKTSTRADIEKILATLEEYLFLNMGRVLIPNLEQTRLFIRYSHGIKKEKKFVHYDINQGITGFIFTSKQAIYADDLDSNSMYLGKLCSTTDLPYANPAITGVPIFNSKNEIKGVLCVNHGYREREELSEIIGVLENTAMLISTLMKRENKIKSCFDFKSF